MDGTGAGVVGAVTGGNLKKEKSWRGVGGEGAAHPPQASLTTMMVVFVLNPLLLLLLLLLVSVVLDFVDGTGAGGVGAVRGGNLKK